MANHLLLLQSVRENCLVSKTNVNKIAFDKSKSKNFDNANLSHKNLKQKTGDQPVFNFCYSIIKVFVSIHQALLHLNSQQGFCWRLLLLLQIFLCIHDPKCPVLQIAKCQYPHTLHLLQI